MDCGEEVSLLRAHLSRVEGVRELHFDVVQARMDVVVDDERLHAGAVERAVATAGMRCEPWRETPAARVEKDWTRLWPWLSGLALATGAAIQVAAGGDWVETLLAHGHAHGGHDTDHMPVAAMAALAVAALTGAATAGRKALAALRARRADMNLLVLVSLAGAVALGEWNEAATLAFLFSLAGRLEVRSLKTARDAISRQLSVAPAEASVVHGDHEHRVEVAAIAAGSIVRVRTGERIPCDGVVVSGSSYVNQALVTGESEAVRREAGDEVFAGTLNESGQFEIRATRPAEDSTLKRMWRMVGDSGSRKAPSERVIETFARHYTPAVLMLALIVATLPPVLHYGTWPEWAYRGMLVLLVACPCALVISTPVTLASALASAAREGVLIKGGAFLEEAARIRAVALAREGVLTSGRPEVAREVDLGDDARAELSAWLKHRANNGQDYALTPRSAGDGALGRQTRELAAQGWTIEPRGATLTALCDGPRTEARRLVDGLRRRGAKHIVLLTGAPEEAARVSGEAAGVDGINSMLSADDKVARIDALAKTYGRVAMVGVSASDGPALAHASLGISFGMTSADISHENSDVIIMPASTGQILFLIDHGRRTLNVIRQNIALAIALKLLFLAAAAAGVATLWMAVAADMGATVAVTLNGLRLLGATPHLDQ